MKINSTNVRKIVSIYPPHWDTLMLPLSVAYVAAFLKSIGFKTQQIDLNHKFRYNHHLTNDELDLEVKKIVSKNPDVVDISIGHTTFIYSITLMELIKQQMPDVSKRMLLKLSSHDYFDKKKEEYKYEDLFRKALRGTKCGC
jgi:hypothetical protein